MSITQAREFIRDTPTPRFTGTPHAKAQYVAYLAATSLAAALVGLAGAALLGGAAHLINSLFG